MSLIHCKHIESILLIKLHHYIKKIKVEHSGNGGINQDLRSSKKLLLLFKRRNFLYLISKFFPPNFRKIVTRRIICTSQLL